MNIPKSRYSMGLLAGVALCCAGTVSAHHRVNPKAGIPVDWHAKVVFISWDGPHVLYRIEVESDHHEVRTWDVLGASPKILSMRKITKSTIHKGERIEVKGWLDPNSRQVAPEVFITEDGRTYEMGFYPPAMTVPK